MSQEQALNQALEAIHFGFRAIIAKPDAILAQMGLARTHHRILYFVGRNAGLSVNDLLRILAVSKQYLNRPLKELVERGLIATETDPQDRRVKRLQLTAQGEALERQLTGEQRRRLAQVFAESSQADVDAWQRVMQLVADARFD
ncbi:MAG: MarR family transcriptional regulator [Gammaproteobacteria bacterium]|nr:MarR family transcriptional regulator [Gammaproteobacteria bacterium]